MSPLTGLLQFVPNSEIANKFLKSEFCLKDILSYKQKDFRSDCYNNVKYDDLEGKILTSGIIENCCFISCFTMLNDSFFEENPPYKLKKEVIEGLERGNVNKHGEKILRPFITIKRANLEHVVNELCIQTKYFFNSINYNGARFSTKAVIYLKLEDYLKKGNEAQKKLNNLRLSNEEIELIDTNKLTRQQKIDLCDALKFMYFTKLKKYQVQNEYRMHIIFDDPLPEKYLDNDLLKIPIKKNLHNYIKVHDDIYNITKYDL